MTDAIKWLQDGNYLAVSFEDAEEMKDVMAAYPRIIKSPSVKKGEIHLLRLIDVNKMARS